MINVAIVGLGWWGRYIVSSLHEKSDNIRFVRAIDVNPDAARPFADQYDLTLSADYTDALQDDQVDAIILTTPHSGHEEQSVLAAVAGKHVFTEKPLSLSKRGAKRVIAACEQAGVVLGVGHERRFEPSLLHIKDLIDSNQLGTIMHVEANFSHDGLADVKADDWRASKTEAPAAAMTSMGIHLTDSFIHMLGPVTEVYALTAKRVSAAQSGDVVSVNLRFENGATGSFSSILATPFFMRFHVFGSVGWIEVRDTVRPECEGQSILASRFKDGDVETREVASIDTVRANLEAFAVAAQGGLPYPVTGLEMIHNIAVLEAIVESSQSGQPVAVS
jgi:predicted dehydrogenase